MDRIFRNIVLLLTVLVVGLLLWYFSSIVSYILISAFLSILGKPLVERLNKIHIKKWKMPASLSAGITLLLIWVITIGAFNFLIPMVAGQASDLAKVDSKELVQSISDPLHNIELFSAQYLPEDQQINIRAIVTEKVASYLNQGSISNVFGRITEIIGNIFVAIFSISFITFFFLKEESLFQSGLFVFIPSRNRGKVKTALTSTFSLLKRYFTGIVIEVAGVGILVTIGMLIIGINFQTAVVLGLISGLLNVIPYIGPIVGGIIGILIGIATHLHFDFYSETIPLLMYMSIIYLVVQLIDNVLFQPFIYSNSVNAHPLEIFLVIMLAGSLAGVTGMILAIPAYTVLRVFAKEFFNHFEVVKEITKKI
ncbi:MAG: AI-2E family transporter [Bacteroidales bacterium]|nr:AI-2E family transporter [Bacteroidales bacterium]